MENNFDALMWDFEECFGVEIPHEAGKKLKTPRQVVRYLTDSLGQEFVHDEHCKTQHAFYHLRRYMQNFGVKRNLIRPETRLDELVPKKQRHAFWNGLMEHFPHADEFYGLQHPGRVRFGIVLATIGVLLLLSLPDMESSVLRSIQNFCIILLPPCFFYGLRWFAYRWTYVFPFDTVGELARDAARAHLSPQQVADYVCEITLGYVHPGAFDMDARFVEDMGIR